MFSLWSRTQKSTLRRAAGGLVTSRTEDLATRHCIKPASDATCLLKLTTTFLLTTHLSPELKYATRVVWQTSSRPVAAAHESGFGPYRPTTAFVSESATICLSRRSAIEDTRS